MKTPSNDIRTDAYEVMKSRTAARALAAGALALGLAAQAHGAVTCTDGLNGPVVTFGFDEAYTDDSVVPDTAPPWLVATFVTTGANTVRLTIDNFLYADPIGSDPVPDFLDRIYFNLNSELGNTPGDWAITVQDLLTVGDIGVDEAVIDFGVTPPPGGGYKPFEVLLDFKDDDHSDRFTAGERLVVDFKYEGAGDFDALDFKEFAFKDGDGASPNPIYAAAHIQSTGDNSEDSAWVHPSMVPEPGSSCALVLLLSSGLILRSRRR